jgi:hypothetical protein
MAEAMALREMLTDLVALASLGAIPRKTLGQCQQD